ncbi:MAG: alpha/beta fold hydrolase [Ktedonobacteraceae bacterium]
MEQQDASFLIGPEHAQTACLLIHGFSGSSAEMLEMGEALAAQGIRAYGMTVAGHSGSPEELLRSGHKQWIASAETALAQLSHYPRVFVVGLSMGGVLSLLLAIRHPTRIAGVIALSTPTRFSGGWQTRLVPLARYFIPWFYPLEQLDFHDPKVQAEVLQQAQLRDPHVTIDFSDAQTVASLKQMVRIPIPAIAELFHMTELCRRQLGKLRLPLLIIHSKRDQTVNPDCALELYRLTEAASPKSLLWLEQSDHVITIGPERAEVFSTVLNFINSRAL